MDLFNSSLISHAASKHWDLIKFVKSLFFGVALSIFFAKVSGNLGGKNDILTVRGASAALFEHRPVR